MYYILVWILHKEISMDTSVQKIISSIIELVNEYAWEIYILRYVCIYTWMVNIFMSILVVFLFVYVSTISLTI